MYDDQTTKTRLSHPDGQTPRLLREHRYTVAGDTVCIRLWQEVPRGPDGGGERFLLGMEGHGTRALCRLERELPCVEALFSLLIRHTVTPCTLYEAIKAAEPGEG